MSEASVCVAGKQISDINRGLVVFLGVSREDTNEDASYLVQKVLNLRLFPDSGNGFDKSALDVGAEILIVSQFTLYGTTRRGRRPDFNTAAASNEAEPLYQSVVDLFKMEGLKIETGRFGQHMNVDIKGDGPVTLMVDSSDRLRSRRGKE